VKKLNVILFGGTGFIGQAISQYFIAQGFGVFIPSRRVKPVKYGKVIPCDLSKVKELLETETEDYFVINLAGESINSGRWTRDRKQRILGSRVQTTRAIVESITACQRKPKLFISASAVGYYGYSETSTFVEKDLAGDGFLAEVTKKWEDEANKAKGQTRVILSRFGLVLGETGGALPQMALPYKFFIGGKVGSGKQWVSWIHVQDIARIFHYCLEHEEIKGAVNFTTPTPIPMHEFGQTLARVLHRPYWLPVPSFALKLLFGEMSEIILQGQKVIPEKVVQSGYTFQYPTIESALMQLMR
jgi:uncharacterized protein